MATGPLLFPWRSQLASHSPPLSRGAAQGRGKRRQVRVADLSATFSSNASDGTTGPRVGFHVHACCYRRVLSTSHQACERFLHGHVSKRWSQGLAKLHPFVVLRLPFLEPKVATGGRLACVCFATQLCCAQKRRFACLSQDGRCAVVKEDHGFRRS